MVSKSEGPVKILAGALDETPNKEVILRGVVSLTTLSHLKVDDYQREALPLTGLTSILGALKAGENLPDIELGMRGEDWVMKDGVHTLKDPVYIIDGFQRVNAALHHLSQHQDADVRIGAAVHFGTTKEWERERFRILNTLRNKVSPNVILRNKREQSPAVQMLYALSTTDKVFVMHDRVSWSQRMTRGELISALTMAKVVGGLLSHKAPTRRVTIDELVPALDKAVEIFGIQNMRANVRGFFDLIDECWGIRRIQYREGAAYVKGTFLNVLARFLSDHLDFWRESDEKVLAVDASLRRKIAQFPVHDPQIANLASSGGKSREMLYMLLREHVNSGKRTRHLRTRMGDVMQLDGDDEE